MFLFIYLTYKMQIFSFLFLITPCSIPLSYAMICEKGQYYDTIFEICKEWNSSWLGAWSYQLHWNLCPSDQILQISNLGWSHSWKGILLENFQNIIPKAWRDMEYYIDSESEEILELGSLKYPYRSANTAAVMIFNETNKYSTTRIIIYTK